MADFTGPCSAVAHFLALLRAGTAAVALCLAAGGGILAAATVNAEMSPGAVTDSVTVSGALPVVDVVLAGKRQAAAGR